MKQLPPSPETVIEFVARNQFTLAVDHERDWNTQPQTDRPLYLGKPVEDSETPWNFQWNPRSRELALWTDFPVEGRRTRFILEGTEAEEFTRLIREKHAERQSSGQGGCGPLG